MKDVDKKKDTGSTAPTFTSADVRFVAGLLGQPAAKPKSGLLAAREMHQALFRS